MIGILRLGSTEIYKELKNIARFMLHLDIMFFPVLAIILLSGVLLHFNTMFSALRGRSRGSGSHGFAHSNVSYSKQ